MNMENETIKNWTNFFFHPWLVMVMMAIDEALDGIQCNRILYDFCFVCSYWCWCRCCFCCSKWVTCERKQQQRATVTKRKKKNHADLHNKMKSTEKMKRTEKKYWKLERELKEERKSGCPTVGNTKSGRVFFFSGCCWCWCWCWWTAIHCLLSFWSFCRLMCLLLLHNSQRFRFFGRYFEPD